MGEEQKTKKLDQEIIAQEQEQAHKEIKEEYDKDRADRMIEPAAPTGVTKDVVQIKDDTMGNRSVTSISMAGGPHKIDVVTEAGKETNANNVVILQPSPLHEYYAGEGFGKVDIIVKGHASTCYNVNMRPMAIDQSPLKESPPGIEDVQPITGYNKAMNHENSYVYTLAIPDSYQHVDETAETEVLTGGCTTQSLPALTILKNSLLGLPASTAEFPVISSPNPACAASYLHAIQHRIGKGGAIDMRFNMTASRKGKMKESYILGRIWTPLVRISIAWDLSHDNYDAAQPILYPAFAEMGKVTLDTRKEITSLVQNMRFVDKNYPPDIEQSLIRIMHQVSNTKMSLARLYWRIWTAIAETTYAESQNKVWHVTRIQHTHNIIHLNAPTVLKGLFSDAELGTQPFFITHAMLDANRGMPLKDIMFFLLSDHFEAEFQFGITRHWPELGDVKIVLPSDMDTVSSQRRSMALHSEDLYRLLEYFAMTLGQQTLIDEIGRTVACFLLRPEGDEAWLGHRHIILRLPPFRCRRSLHLAWAMQGYELKYKFKTPPYYKLAWIGCIRYMQIALCANTVLNEMGFYTVLQLAANNVIMPDEWYRNAKRLFRESNKIVQLNEKIQQVGLRTDWGCVLNRITASATIIKVNINNLARINQWYEWLLFQRLLPEGTWMAGQIGHIRAKTQLKPGRSYNPKLCGIESGVNDVYYRMATQDTAKMMIHVSSFAIGSFQARTAVTLGTCTGLPMDGQYRYISAGDDVHAFFHFVPRTIEECYIMMHEWHERTEYHWQMHVPKKYFHTAMGKKEGEIVLESQIEPPSETLYQQFVFEGVHSYAPIELAQLRTTRASEIIVYGTPTVTGDSESDAEDIEDGDIGGPVDPEEVYRQLYPIHYCDEETRPTVGAKILRYGTKVKKTWGGMDMLSTEARYRRALEDEAEASFILYKPPEFPERSKEWSKNQRKKAREKARLERRRSESEREEKERREKMEEKERQREQMVVELEREAKKKLELAAKAQEVIRPVNVTKQKEIYKGWCRSTGCDIEKVEQSDIWNMFNGMEDINMSAPGAKLALQNRYTGILQKMDNIDIIAMLKPVPVNSRGEFCRIMYNIINECTQFLTMSSHDRNIHNQLSKFFGTAMDNLAVCGAIDDEELKIAVGNPHAHIEDWKAIGTVSCEDYNSIITMALCMTGEEEAEGSGTVTGVIPGKDNEICNQNDNDADVAQTSPEAIIEKAIKNTITSTPIDQQENFQLSKDSCSAQSPSTLAASREQDGSKSVPEKIEEKKKDSSSEFSMSETDSAVAKNGAPKHSSKRTHAMQTCAMAKAIGVEEPLLMLTSESVAESSGSFKSAVSQSQSSSSNAIFEKSYQ